ncbi:hypothetical protein BCD67_17160 [Oscillatoriales cyanobacterium USR001]|nr:hypothetical protein BCD67_17160 [Oscillatoriales cyanobacterium USR001]
MISNVFIETPINRQEIPQELLDIADKKRTNPMPWKGQFSPQLIEAILNKYAYKNSVVFDPFLGSGTVLYEAGRLGIEAYGTEINPAAFTLANIYKFINLSQTQRKRWIDYFLEELNHNIFDPRQLSPKSQKEIPQNDIEKLISLAVNNDDKFLKILYESLVILLLIGRVILALKNYVWAVNSCFCTARDCA